MALDRLSLCMIVRDEEEVLSECLCSAARVADEMVVVDTGSCDDTLRIAHAMGARVFHHEWRDDFSEARNFSIEHATGDWILWMDADERLREDETARIEGALQERNAVAFLVPILNHTPDGAHVSRGHRLFRNHLGIRFSRRIHEQISPSLARIGGKTAPAPFTIDHVGYAVAPGKLRRKNERNLRLLHQAKENDPRDAYIRFTFAQALLIAGQVEAAEKEVLVALGRVPNERVRRPLPPDLRAAALNNLADCALRRGDPKAALAQCAESLRIIPRQTTAHLMAYKAWSALGETRSALDALEATTRILEGAGSPGGTAIEVTMDLADLRLAMGRCCLRLNRPDEARRHFAKVVEKDSKRPQGLAGLAQCALVEGDIAAGCRYSDEALALEPGDDALLNLSSLLLLKNGRFEAAAERIGRLCLRHPEDPALRKRLAGVLVKLGRSKDAVAVLAST